MEIPEAELRDRESQVIATGGILPMYEAFYIEALTYSADRAQSAFQRFDDAISRKADQATIVATAHEALTHVAGLSRYFWPVRGKQLHIARAEKLRSAFEIDEGSPLADRGLRNVLEHFDERLDTFLLKDLVGYVFPGPIVGDASLSEDERGSIFRLVDPEAQVFVLLGEQYAFGPMRRAVDDTLERLRELTGGRLTPR